MDLIMDSISIAELYIVQLATVTCDLIGVAVLMATILRSAINYFRQNARVRLMLAQGISLALGFKLGGEVLRSVTVRDWNEFAILGAIIVLRAAITWLIHWEIKTEISEEKQFEAEMKLGEVRKKKRKKFDSLFENEQDNVQEVELEVVGGVE